MATDSKDVLVWTGRVFSADDLRRHWQGQKELILPTRTILTPLAVDDLKSKGIKVQRQDTKADAKAAAASWRWTQDKPDAIVAAALASLAREKIAPAAWSLPTGKPWLQALLEGLKKSTAGGSLVFCGDPALVACLANKLAGVRAANVNNVAAAGQALKSLGANVLAIESPGRTFFELRQMIKAAWGTVPACPPEVTAALKEALGHADR